MPRKLGVEELREPGRRHVDAVPALVRIAEGERKPFAPHRRLSARARRVRRDERRLRQQRLPRPADLDQVVAVGAIAVHEHDQLARGSAFRRKPRTVDLTGHCGLASSLRLSLPRRNLDQHAVAALRDAIVRPEQPRRDCAIRPPAFGERPHFLRGRALVESEGEARGLLQREIAGRPGVRMAEAGEQIEVRGPRTDAVQSRQHARARRRPACRRALQGRSRARRSPWRSPSAS